MIRNIFTAICWFLIGICILSIGIVIIWGGIYLFSIGDFHVAVHDIRRPAGFLLVFSIILLFLKNINIKMVLAKAEDVCSGKFVWYLSGFFVLLFIWIKTV